MSLTTHASVTPEREHSFSESPMVLPALIVCQILRLSFPLLTTFIQTEEYCPVYKLPVVVDRQKIYPGIKDLPSHIRVNFRNGFIRHVIRDVFNSEQPWANPDLSALQQAHNCTYSAYPAQLQHNDAICHPVGIFIFFSDCLLTQN